MSAKISLNVEEYSPTILAGSFSGRLVDPELPRDVPRSDNPVLPVVDTIKGRFVIAAPLKGDNPPSEPPPSAPPTGEELDMIKAFTGCDCSCAAQNTTDPQCQAVCGASYAYCGEGQDGGMNDADRISALREKFLSKMAKKYPPDTPQLVMDALAQSFDEAASYQEKELLYRVMVGEAP